MGTVGDPIFRHPHSQGTNWRHATLGTDMGILAITNILKVLPVMELTEAYTTAVFYLVMEFTIWVNILENFGKEAIASAYVTPYNFTRSS
jgi:hypothetical protein